MIKACGVIDEFEIPNFYCSGKLIHSYKPRFPFNFLLAIIAILTAAI